MIDLDGPDLFDGAFIGPLLPPPPPSGPLLPPPPPGVLLSSGPLLPPRPEPTDAVLAIPLAPRKLAGQAFDLLSRSDSGLRGASFYIGFLLTVTLGPAIALAVLAVMAAGLGAESWTGYRPPAWELWLMLAVLPAFLGYIGAAVDARGLAVAVIGGRAEGRPLRLRESIAIARARFWQLLGAQLVVGIISTIVSAIATTAVSAVIGSVEAIDTGVTLIASLVVGIPFAYVAVGIVLGEASVGEALSRSIRLARLRPMLAVTVTLFSVGSQFILLLGLGAGAEASSLVVTGLRLDTGFPLPLAIPAVAVLVFAFGTLVFLAEAFAAAPAVYAFEALTHYTAGLESGRRSPASTRFPWDPWLTPGLAVAAAVAMAALVAGVLTLNG
jgi:hypothetical protein